LTTIKKGRIKGALFLDAPWEGGWGKGAPTDSTGWEIVELEGGKLEEASNVRGWWKKHLGSGKESLRGEIIVVRYWKSGAEGRKGGNILREDNPFTHSWEREIGKEKKSLCWGKKDEVGKGDGGKEKTSEIALQNGGEVWKKSRVTIEEKAAGIST